jgi:hypothetical protein
VKPPVPVHLVDVHGAAEHQHGTVTLDGRGGLGGRGDRPLVERVPAARHDVREDAGRGIRLVDDRQDAHRISVQSP